MPLVQTRACTMCCSSRKNPVVYVFFDVVLNAIGAVRSLSKTLQSIRAGLDSVRTRVRGSRCQ